MLSEYVKTIQNPSQQLSLLLPASYKYLRTVLYTVENICTGDAYDYRLGQGAQCVIWAVTRAVPFSPSPV